MDDQNENHTIENVQNYTYAMSVGKYISQTEN